MIRVRVYLRACIAVYAGRPSTPPLNVPHLFRPLFLPPIKQLEEVVNEHILGEKELLLVILFLLHGRLQYVIFNNNTTPTTTTTTT